MTQLQWKVDSDWRLATGSFHEKNRDWSENNDDVCLGIPYEHGMPVLFGNVSKFRR